MLTIYPNYEGLVSLWSIGRPGSIKTFSLPQDTYSNVFPEPKTPSIDELRRSFMRDTGIYSSSILRNARLFSSGFYIPPLQSTDGLPIYTTSIKRLIEGYTVGTLTKGYLWDTYF
jgi:hypothetical protein